MNRYIRFDSKKFLKESKRWEKEKEKLLEEMAELAELQKKGESNGKSQSISDNTAGAVIDRQRLQRQVDRLDNYQQALNYAWKHLSDEQREALTALFFTNGIMSHNVSDCAQKLAVCVDKVYKLSREALEEVADLVEEWYKA